MRKRENGARSKGVYLLSRTAKVAILMSIIAMLLVWFIFNSKSETKAEGQAAALDAAMYTREEFFGSQALIPLPTAIARENLRRLADASPDSPEVLEKLADAEEHLADFDAAEAILARMADIDPKKLLPLADFYGRRGRFADEAGVLRKALTTENAGSKTDIFMRLLETAKMHDLKAYQTNEFYSEIVSENANLYPVFDELIDWLISEDNKADALIYLRQAKELFPSNTAKLSEKEISLLTDMGKAAEAEKVYTASFDPFWSDDQAEAFYDFLTNHDRLREYGAEWKAKFDRDNADFNAAVRLAHYRYYRSEDAVLVFQKLERAKKSWTTDELLTATRFLIRQNEGDLASRFLYTLSSRGDMRAGGEFRQQSLYQLFEMLSDAEAQRLPLTKGDLGFYKTAATIDTHPGITTGILSLIFSDTNLKAKFVNKETAANKLFNRAAAYRVFLAYKDEFPGTPELGQMYLDLVRLYTAAGELDVARKTLDEFAAGHKNAPDLPAVEFKLADAFLAVKDTESSRRIYREMLDQLGDTATSQTVVSDKNRNVGINIPPAVQPGEHESFADSPGRFTDYLGSQVEAIGYREVLERLVGSLSNEKKTPEILELLSGEISKHPQAEWLYDMRLTWLEQTNLLDEQLAVYRTAGDRFRTSGWNDKLARGLLRQHRQDEFAELSSSLIDKLDDNDTKNYLTEFISQNVTGSDFDRRLYLNLYQAAHQRFPHNIDFVVGLLKFYRAAKMDDEWRRLAGEYYFESPDVRKLYLDDLAAAGRLREAAASAPRGGAVYKLFHADAAIRLSKFEEAVSAYRDLNEAYPNSAGFAEELIKLTRSFGQKDERSLSDASTLAHARAEFSRDSSEVRIRSGEILAEMGEYGQARQEWDASIETASGSRDSYLEAATVYWDYFQYADALRTIKTMRAKFADETLCSFEAGAVYEDMHDMPAAVGEYVKALDANRDQTQNEKAKGRLTTLAKRTGINDMIARSFAAERLRRNDASFLTLGYAQFLAGIMNTAAAERELNQAISKSREGEFLEAARDFYVEQKTASGEAASLRRLEETTESPRRKIKYGFQLAELFRDNHNINEARSTLTALVAKFPNNYGVVTGAADAYHQLGFDDASADVLRSAMSRGHGRYRAQLAGKLSSRLVQLGRLDEAEQVLSGLHREFPADLDVFHELAGVYVRVNKGDALRSAFTETIAALKSSDADRREMDTEIADFRTQLIAAFTQLKDYDAAIEQHIEIVNRDPDDDRLVDAAIAYATRFGGAGKLLEYYQRTSAAAFKNYRWNMVLARIYAAKGDQANAIQNYRSAIVNQPEMPELYIAVADIETDQHYFDAALRDMDTVLELTNDQPEYVKKKIEILKKAGRLSEVGIEKAKLPAASLPAAPDGKFTEASKMSETGNPDEARRIYREALANLLREPLGGELKSAEISSYVASLRDEEPLQTVAEPLWVLREKLITLADETGSTRAGEARLRLATLDGALAESVGRILKTTATDDELAAVHEDLIRRMDAAGSRPDNRATLAMIRDLSSRAGFGDIEEKLLIKKAEDAEPDMREAAVRNLVSFYDACGAFENSFRVLEKYGSGEAVYVAEHARLAGSKDKELEALRLIYSRPGEKMEVDSNAYVSRYLGIIYSENKAELESLAHKSAAYQLQLINFLLAKGEPDLARSAIEAANLPPVWKSSRIAEMNLALGVSGDAAESSFISALRIEPIGTMITRTPDKQRFLAGDDWFRLTREYGELLERSPQVEKHFSGNLSAMTEARPNAAAEQTSLGTFYLKQKNTIKAIKHFRIALEQEPDEPDAMVDLGSALFLSAQKQEAEKLFDQALGGATPETLLVFYNRLNEFGLGSEAKHHLSAKIVEFLVHENVDDSKDIQTLIQTIAASFTDEDQKSLYFQSIMSRRPKDTSLAAFLITEHLVDKTHTDAFFERLIQVSSGIDSYDTSFKSALDRSWNSLVSAESVYDQENDYRVEDADGGRIDWQQKYLEVLIERRENANALALIDQIESDLRGRYARPVWLRMARMRLSVRMRQFDLAEAEQICGIRVSDAASEIRPPDVERFNSAIQILTEEHSDDGILQLSESYFARNLALGLYENTYFDGLARTYFKKGETARAVGVLRWMIDVNYEATRASAIAEIDNLDSVNAHAADPAKYEAPSADVSYAPAEALELAAKICAEFDDLNEAIAFRKNLQKIAPGDTANILDLARLLVRSGDAASANSLLSAVVNDRNATRSARWQAKWQLHKNGDAIVIPDIAYDGFSQFYNGLLTGESSGNRSAVDYFAKSVIARTETEIPTRAELIRAYIASGKPYAAIRLAASDKSQKPDELYDELSQAAEQIGDFANALEFEKLQTNGGDLARTAALQRSAALAAQRATDMVVTTANTREL